MSGADPIGQGEISGQATPVVEVFDRIVAYCTGVDREIGPRSDIPVICSQTTDDEI
jgi:hypothetical protein